MADHPPPPGRPRSDPGSSWPHRPAHPEPEERTPWARRIPAGDAGDPGRPPPLPGPADPPAPAPPPPTDRRRLVIVGVAVALAVLAVAVVGLVVSRRGSGTDEAKAPGVTGVTAAPPAGSGVPGGPGKELTLLGGRLVVAARPGWEQLDSAPDSASVRLALRGAPGQELLSTLSIATLSSASSFDTVLLIKDGTGFEVKGADGPYRVTVQPSPGARILAGAARPRGAFFLNVSISPLDGKALDVPTLRALFTDQIAPALRFP
ncbi:MAG: hypothetical protein ABIS47_07165 [Acidimicrobiales bacterium]